MARRWQSLSARPFCGYQQGHDCYHQQRMRRVANQCELEAASASASTWCTSRAETMPGTTRPNKVFARNAKWEAPKYSSP